METSERTHNAIKYVLIVIFFLISKVSKQQNIAQTTWNTKNTDFPRTDRDRLLAAYNQLNYFPFCLFMFLVLLAAKCIVYIGQLLLVLESNTKSTSSLSVALCHSLHLFCFYIASILISLSLSIATLSECPGSGWCVCVCANQNQRFIT